MRRASPVAVVGVVVLALVLVVSGCAGRAGQGTGSAPPGAPPSSTPPGAASSPAPVAQPPAGSGGAGAGQPTPSPLPDAQVTPLSPGVEASGPSAARDLQVRALVQYQVATFEPASVTLELDGQPLQARVLKEKTEFEPGVRRLIVAAAATGLADGPHVARLRMGGRDGRKTGAEWRFSVAAPGGAAGGSPGAAPLTLYFADQPLVVIGLNGEFGMVTPVRRVVAATPAPARAAVEQLIAGPQPADGEVGRTVPGTARLRGLTIRDGVARVDFSQEFARDHWGGTTGGAITVQSVIYTLTEFPSVKSVQVLVEGQPWSDGHFVWDTPWARPAPAVEVVSLPPCP